LEFNAKDIKDDFLPIKDYWLKVFKFCSILKEEISEKD
jgi:hypothetical protein